MIKKDDSQNSIVNHAIIHLMRNWKLLIYTFCGLGLAWIDLWRGIGNGAQWALAVNCTGFCIFPMIVLRLDWRMLSPKRSLTERWQKIFRVLFYLWTALFLLCAYPVFRKLAPGTDYDGQIATAIANAGIYGALLIRMYFYLFFERKQSGQEENPKTGPVFFVWLLFMVLAVASVNKTIWPLWFMVMFGSFYLAPLSKKDLEEITLGIVNGLIIGFFWIQSRAFLYRPYDADFRYYGHYTNPNVNAMFYLFTYIAWLMKLAFYRAQRARKRYIATFVFASSMWVFVFFTGCRSAWLGFAGVSVVYWLAESRIYKKKRILKAAGSFALMLATAAVTFLPVYGCMRYIPPLRHHPIWYQAEYSEDRVMAWDPIDSPKYWELDEIMPRIAGRFVSVAAVEASSGDEVQTDERIDGDDKLNEDAASESAMHAHTAVCAEGSEMVASYSCGITPGTDSLHPIFTGTDYKSSLLRRGLKIRYYIYSYIISQIKPFGNEGFTVDAWIFESFHLYHTHNTFLQIFYWFGTFAGMLFLVLLLATAVSAVLILGKHEKSGSEIRNVSLSEITLMVISGFGLAGMTECVAFPGEMGLTLFFLSLIYVIRYIGLHNNVR